MTQWNGCSERRRHRRAGIRLVVEYTDPLAGPGESATRLETLNLSAGGFSCRANREISELTRLALRLVFPPLEGCEAGERTIDCEAVVVRCAREREADGRFQIAACFIGLGPQDQGFIEEFVDRHCRSEDEAAAKGKGCAASGNAGTHRG